MIVLNSIQLFFTQKKSHKQLFSLVISIIRPSFQSCLKMAETFLL